MRVIAEAFLTHEAERHPEAAKYLEAWLAAVQRATWRSLLDVRRTYPSADPVLVRSGRQVYIFNACGNAYRLIVAIHFNRQIIYTLRFLTHAEYTKNYWKTEL